MTLRQYTGQMGLRITRDIAPGGFRCSIIGVRLADSCGKPAASADGQTLDEALTALATLISRHVLQDTVRQTALYWVPELVR